VKVTRALWKKETGACAWTRLENGREQNGVRGVVAAGEAAGGVGAVVEEVLTMIVVDVLETVAGAAGVDAPDPHHDLGPGHLEEEVLLLVIPRSVLGALGPALSALPEGIALQDGTRGHNQGPVPLHLAGGSVLSLPPLPVIARLALAARSEIAVVPLLAEGVTRQATVLGHVVEALATGQVGVVDPPPLHDAENRASLDLPPRKAGDVKEARATAAAALAVNLPVMEPMWTPIVAA